MGLSGNEQADEDPGHSRHEDMIEVIVCELRQRLIDAQIGPDGAGR